MRSAHTAFASTPRSALIELAKTERFRYIKNEREQEKESVFITGSDRERERLGC